MSVLVIAENNGGKFKKSALEAVHYGHLCAQSLGGNCIALVVGESNELDILGEYGAQHVLHYASDIGEMDGNVMTSLVSKAFEEKGCHTVVMNHSSLGKSIVGRVANRLSAGSITSANSVPVADGGSVRIKRPVFAGKAIAEFKINSPNRVISLMSNAFPPEKVAGSCEVESFDTDLPDAMVRIVETKKVEGTVPLPEAELVVSAGRGMKAPENWEIIEELARTIGAATACSRPVADTGWRPHHEHVGQTGVAIRPNLYIAAGISGAIQHLAGVNGSKCIVVINKDSEAPFFKAADYGICADLFDVVPRLTEAFKKALEE